MFCQVATNETFATINKGDKTLPGNSIDDYRELICIHFKMHCVNCLQTWRCKLMSFQLKFCPLSGIINIKLI